MHFPHHSSSYLIFYFSSLYNRLFPSQHKKDPKYFSESQQLLANDPALVFHDRLDELYRELLEETAVNKSGLKFSSSPSSLAQSLLLQDGNENNLKNYFYHKLLQEQEIAKNRPVSQQAEQQLLIPNVLPNTSGALFSMKSTREFDLFDHKIMSKIEKQTDNDLQEFAKVVSDQLFMKLLIESVASVHEGLSGEEDVEES
jgi:hypothetical protein